MIIKQDEYLDIAVKINDEHFHMIQWADNIHIDKQGAKQLIEVLQEWVGENDETNT